MRSRSDPVKAISSGLAGAAALTLLHESARQVIPHAPRVDVIGMRTIRRPMVAMGAQPPRGRTLYKLSLLEELASNGLYYAMVGTGRSRNPVQRGLVLGILAGLGAVFLPPAMGLGNQPHRRAPYTQVMTVAWYTFGGVVAGVVARMFEK